MSINTGSRTRRCDGSVCSTQAGFPLPGGPGAAITAGATAPHDGPWGRCCVALVRWRRGGALPAFIIVLKKLQRTKRDGSHCKTGTIA